MFLKSEIDCACGRDTYRVFFCSPPMNKSGFFSFFVKVLPFENLMVHSCVIILDKT